MVQDGIAYKHNACGYVIHFCLESRQDVRNGF